MEAMLVAVGGALGAILRYAVGQLLASRSFPWATLTVNVVGSFVLGVVLFGPVDDDLAVLVGTGFCGAFTTFSSFSFETVDLWERGRRRRAVVNAVGNLVASVLAIGVVWLVLTGPSG